MEGYGQDKPERCSKPAWPSSRASAFGAAEGPIAGGAVCSLKPLTRSFGPKAPGSLKSERGVGLRERVFVEARVSTLGGPTARSLAPLLSRENISNCGFRVYLGCTPPSSSSRRGRFPSGRSELPDEAVAWVARQVKVPASDLGLFDWEGRTAERARKTVRTFLGFLECSVADADKLTADTGRQLTQPHP